MPPGPYLACNCAQVPWHPHITRLACEELVGAGALPLLVQALQPGGRRPDAQQAAAKVLLKVSYLLADDSRAAQLLPGLLPALQPLLDILGASGTESWLARSTGLALMGMMRRSHVLAASAARAGAAARLARWGFEAESWENMLLIHEEMAGSMGGGGGMSAVDALMAAAARLDREMGDIVPNGREANFVMPAKEPPAARKCAACGAAARSDGRALMACSACTAVSYCSAACQRGHWKQHRASCRASAAGGAGK